MALPTFTLGEISKHNKENDSWIVIKNKVYNVTNWMPKHPGGSSLIMNLAGKDCTDEFEIFHYEPNYKRLKPMLIGHVEEHEIKHETALGKDVKKLHAHLKSLGAFKPDYWFYFQRFVIIASLFTASITLLLSSSSIWYCLLSALCLGLFWQQLAFVGHDLGHHVVTHDRKLDDTISIFVGNAIQGISLEWWKHSHNTHHTLTNSINHDPDIQHLPFMAISKDFFRSIFSTYHKRILRFDAFSKTFVGIQQYMFYPIMALARFNLYAQSFIHNIVGPGSKFPDRQRIELLSLAAFWVWFSGVLYLTGSLSHGFLFLLLSHAVAGLVHVQICLSHFSMETYEGVPQSSFENDGYIRSQLMTTMDVDCHPMLDFFHGGLQFQVEHHLFPHISRSWLRYAQTQVQQLCKMHNLPFLNKTFYEANYDVVRRLRETSKELKLSNMFYDGVNMIG